MLRFKGDFHNYYKKIFILEINCLRGAHFTENLAVGPVLL